MDVFTNIISQYLNMSNHHIVHLSYIILLVNLFVLFSLNKKNTNKKVVAKVEKKC
jgi:hypothetical protein